jgi:cytochrome c oxidase cbb3-type subunit I/II
MRKLGVPYPENYESIAVKDLEAQAKKITDNLASQSNIKISSDKEIIAVIAYLQRLGKDIQLENKQ